MKKAFIKDQRGFTLIEVILAIALLGIIAVAFLGAMGTGSLALFIADERATAESLARSQMEYVKNQGYKVVESYETIEPPAGYDIKLDPPPVQLEPGLQKITVTVSHHGKPVVTLEGYKVDR